MTTTTTNYTWQMPDPGASSNTWGDTLNKTTQAIDAQVFVNQQGLAPVGAITMFGGATAPANWLLCAGQMLSTAAPYDKLFAVLQYAFGGSGVNFRLPNLGAQFPIGVGANLQGRSTALGEVSGNFTIPISVANLPAHAHPIIDVQHTHTASPHTHTDSGHAHQLPGSLDYGIGAVSPPSPLVSPNLSPLASTGVGAAQIQNAIVSIASSGTNLTTTQSVGSSTPLDVIPPFVALNFIIRYK